MVLKMTVLACTQTKLDSFAVTLSAIQAQGLPIPAGKYYFYAPAELEEGTNFLQDMEKVEVKLKDFSFTTEEGKQMTTTLRYISL